MIWPADLLGRRCGIRDACPAPIHINRYSYLHEHWLELGLRYQIPEPVDWTNSTVELTWLHSDLLA